MKAIIQRVKEAGVRLEERVVARIDKGILVLLGIEKEDGEKDSSWLAEKIVNLRIFEDREGRMNLSILDIRGEILVVSQFSLLADCRKGRRPSFDKAAPPERAKSLYNNFVSKLRGSGLEVEEGKFQAKMEVFLINDGPLTFVLESKG